MCSSYHGATRGLREPPDQKKHPSSLRWEREACTWRLTCFTSPAPPDEEPSDSPDAIPRCSGLTLNAGLQIQIRSCKFKALVKTPSGPTPQILTVSPTPTTRPALPALRCGRRRARQHRGLHPSPRVLELPGMFGLLLPATHLCWPAMAGSKEVDCGKQTTAVHFLSHLVTESWKVSRTGFK